MDDEFEQLEYILGNSTLNDDINDDIYINHDYDISDSPFYLESSDYDNLNKIVTLTDDDIIYIHNNLYLPNNYTSIEMLNDHNILKYYNINVYYYKYGNMNNVYAGTYNHNGNILKVYIKFFMYNDKNYKVESEILTKYNTNFYIVKDYIKECKLYFIIYKYFKDVYNIVLKSYKNELNFIINHNMAYVFNMFNLIDNYYFYPKILGKGTYGVNYLAYSVNDNKLVAIKLIYNYSNEVINNFNKEVYILNILSNNSKCHSNILCYLNHGLLLNNILLYIITDYIKGDTLYNIIYNVDISLYDKYNIMIQLAQSLQYIHSKNILHLDIKPDNVIYDVENKNICIIDFGLSCMRNGNIYKCNKNKATGTPLYMAPELLLNNKLSYSIYNDIYSLGITFFEILTGSVLFNLKQSELNYSTKLQYYIFKDNVRKNDLSQLNLINDNVIKNMIANMININPNKRINLQTCINIISNNYYNE